MHKLISFAVLLGLFSIAFEAGAVCTAGSPNASTAEATPTSAFTDNGDGTVTHSLTGLMWKQCVEGTSGAACATGSAASYSWSQALLQAKNSSYAAHTDWRLPNNKELQSIVETCGSSPAINQLIFPATPASYFWSGSSYVAGPTYAWGVYFYDGDSYANLKTSYYYVRLVRGGQSFDSFALPVVTLPGVPVLSTVTAGNAQALVNFTAPTSNGGTVITGYTVISNPAGGVDSNAGSPSLSHTITGLVKGTSYTFTVTATNAAGTGAASVASGSVLIPATAPDAPGISTVTPGNAQAVVNFTAPASNGGAVITGYTVSSNPAGGVDSNAGSLSLSHVITGLANGTPYTFTVTATNSVGTGVASSVSGSVTPATVPAAPTAVLAVPSNARATVSFTAPLNNGGAVITAYTVTSSPGGFSATGSGSPLTVTGLSNGTSYTFSVTASNWAGNSSASTASSPVIPTRVPDAPGGVSAVASNAQASVSFGTPYNADLYPEPALPDTVTCVA